MSKKTVQTYSKKTIVGEVKPFGTRLGCGEPLPVDVPMAEKNNERIASAVDELHNLFCVNILFLIV
jgi:hypothetical protein